MKSLKDLDVSPPILDNQIAALEGIFKSNKTLIVRLCQVLNKLRHYQQIVFLSFRSCYNNTIVISPKICRQIR
jgi:hypothetical protein